jgi:hypothetical protein
MAKIIEYGPPYPLYIKLWFWFRVLAILGIIIELLGRSK